MKKVDQSNRWSPAQLPELWFQKPKPQQLQFSLWDLCCVMALTGLGVGLARWYWGGFSGVLAIAIWSIVAGCLVFTMQGREIRTLVIIAVLCGLAMLAGAWLGGLGKAIDIENQMHGDPNSSSGIRYNPNGMSDADVTKEIARLKALRNSGRITQQEYEDAINDEGLAPFYH
jgi:hypothetical protein